MPATSDGAMGRVPNDGEGKPPGDLQRALEAELVDHLRVQNAKLMEELDRLRHLQSQQGSASNSNSSCVEVGRDSTMGMDRVQHEQKECGGRAGYSS